jgi:hypothetical protein
LELVSLQTITGVYCDSGVEWTSDPSTANGPLIWKTTITFSCKWTFERKNYGDIVYKTADGQTSLGISEQYGAMVKAYGKYYMQYVCTKFYKFRRDNISITFTAF